MDYLGEAGSGCFYYDADRDLCPTGPLVLPIWEILILSVTAAHKLFREIVYGLRTAPYIAVERLNHYGEKVNKSAWAWKDEIASWTWDGYEGKPAIVNVYAAAEEIELFLNGKSMGRKNAGEEHEWMCSYEILMNREN